MAKDMKIRNVSAILLVAIVAGSVIAYLRLSNRESTAYHNPVDGKTYIADWREYEPETPCGETPDSKVTLTQLRLLDEQDKFDRNVDVTELASYVQRIEQSISQVVMSDTSYDLIVKCTLGSVTNEFEMASNRDASNDELQKIYDGLNDTVPLHTKSESVTFQAEFAIDGTP